MNLLFDQDELETIADGIEVTKSCFKMFLIHSSNNAIMEMDRLPRRHAILLKWRTGNRKFIWSGLMLDSSHVGFAAEIE